MDACYHRDGKRMSGAPLLDWPITNFKYKPAWPGIQLLRARKKSAIQREGPKKHWRVSSHFGVLKAHWACGKLANPTRG